MKLYPKKTKKKIQRANKKRAPIVEFLVVIVNRGRGENVAKILNSLRIDLQVLSLGHGTADSTVADFLGMNLNEKEILFAIIKLKDSDFILKTLNQKLEFNEKNTGIALTLPIKSATMGLLETIGFGF